MFFHARPTSSPFLKGPVVPPLSFRLPRPPAPTTLGHILLSLLSLSRRGLRKAGGKNCWSDNCKLGCRDQAARHQTELVGILFPLENTTKLHQDLMIAQLLAGAGTNDGSPGSRRQFRIGAMQVCKRGFIGILGIGGYRFKRLQGGELDARYGDRARGDPRGHQGHAYSAMFTHLWAVYNSHAETRADDVVVDAHDPLQTPSATSRAQLAAFRSASEASNLPSNVTFGPNGKGFTIEPTEDTPLRWLPPGSKMDVWWLYLANVNADGGEKPAQGSYPTMMRVWHDVFRKILKIGRFGKHAMCNDCYQMKQNITLAATYADKLVFSKQLTTHLERQWRDRMVYWRMRAHARKTDANWLVIIVDGADQAKFRVLKSVETPKSVQGLWRPKMKVVGAWAHGCELAFNFVEEDMPHNNNLTMEILMQSLDRILRNLADGERFPCHLWVQMDNCQGDNKSGHMCKWFSWLVDKGIFRTAVASYLQVGHTHEDIDFLFSVMSTGIAKMQQWDTPQQMADCVQRNMTSHVTRTMNNIPVVSGMLPAVRNWQSWLDGYAGIRYDQGFEGISKIHWMCFLRRKDLPITFADQPLAGPAHGSSPQNDVMLLCKEYMSDNTLSQPPLMFAPGGSALGLKPLNGPVAWEARKDIDEDLVDKLCKQIMDRMPERAPAVEYLRQWASLPRMHPHPPEVLDIVDYRYGSPQRGGEFGPAFAEAMRTDGGTQSKPAVVHRIKRRRTDPPPHQFTINLATYVDYRCQQGLTFDEAMQEWNGGRIAHAVRDM